MIHAVRILLFCLPLLAFEAVAADADLSFDYAPPIAGVSFEVERSTAAAGPWARVTMSAPVPVPPLAPGGAPRYVMKHPADNANAGRWFYRLRSVVNGAPSAWTTVTPSPVEIPPVGPTNATLQTTGSTTQTVQGAP